MKVLAFDFQSHNFYLYFRINFLCLIDTSLTNLILKFKNKLKNFEKSFAKFASKIECIFDRFTSIFSLYLDNISISKQI